MKLFMFLSIMMTATVSMSSAMPILSCRSLTKVEGWVGTSTEDFVVYTAFIKDATSLHDAKIEGAYITSPQDLNADPDLKNKYRNYRFGPLEDAWANFNLLIPKDYFDLNGPFQASIQMFKEDVYIPHYINLICFIK